MLFDIRTYYNGKLPQKVYLPHRIIRFARRSLLLPEARHQDRQHGEDLQTSHHHQEGEKPLRGIWQIDKGIGRSDRP